MRLAYWNIYIIYNISFSNIVEWRQECQPIKSHLPSKSIENPPVCKYFFEHVLKCELVLHSWALQFILNMALKKIPNQGHQVPVGTRSTKKIKTKTSVLPTSLMSFFYFLSNLIPSLCTWYIMFHAKKHQEFKTMASANLHLLLFF